MNKHDKQIKQVKHICVAMKRHSRSGKLPNRGVSPTGGFSNHGLTSAFVSNKNIKHISRNLQIICKKYIQKYTKKPCLKKL